VFLWLRLFAQTDGYSIVTEAGKIRIDWAQCADDDNNLLAVNDNPEITSRVNDFDCRQQNWNVEDVDLTLVDEQSPATWLESRWGSVVVYSFASSRLWRWRRQWNCTAAAVLLTWREYTCKLGSRQHIDAGADRALRPRG